MTRTVSPGSNAGMSVRMPSRATSANRSMVGPSAPAGAWCDRAANKLLCLAHPVIPTLVPGPQVGPPIAGEPLGLRFAPGGDPGMIPREQHVGDGQPAVLGRPGVARRTQESIVVRVRAGRLVVA